MKTTTNGLEMVLVTFILTLYAITMKLGITLEQLEMLMEIQELSIIQQLRK